MTLGILFLGLALVLFGLLVLAFIQLGSQRFHSRIGRANDGLPVGSRAPEWGAYDTDGDWHSVPSRSRWQVLVFADHSLEHFPSVVGGLNDFASDRSREVVVVPNRPPEIVVPALKTLGLALPIVPVEAQFWFAHNVHAMPFVIVVDADGVVRANSLLNQDYQLGHVFRLAYGGGRPLRPVEVAFG